MSAADHRRPPPLAHADAPRGTCRLCGELVPGGTNWHRRCLSLWLIASTPAFTRVFVFKRDGGVCVDCAKTDPRHDGDWDVDHGVPLRDAPRELRYWLPPNLFTRCTRCHRTKTARENAARRQSGKAS